MNGTATSSSAQLGAAAREAAGVVARPPRILLGFILVGVALDLLWPRPFLPGWPQYAGGGGLVALGLALFVWACLTMRRAGTNIPTSRPTIRIVRHGPFRLSRNPIYLSMAMVFLGTAAMVDGAWLFALFPIWAVLMEWGVIRREERYLAARFGDDYLSYRRTVRRWI